jgi:hypothetical protein
MEYTKTSSRFSRIFTSTNDNKFLVSNLNTSKSNLNASKIVKKKLNFFNFCLIYSKGLLPLFHFFIKIDLF